MKHLWVLIHCNEIFWAYDLPSQKSERGSLHRIPVSITVRGVLQTLRWHDSLLEKSQWHELSVFIFLVPLRPNMNLSHQTHRSQANHCPGDSHRGPEQNHRQTGRPGAPTVHSGGGGNPSAARRSRSAAALREDVRAGRSVQAKPGQRPWPRGHFSAGLGSYM